MIKFEEILEKEGKLTYFNYGVSMLPMLRPKKDTFTIVKKDGNRCKENDVVLFKLNGRYILHRVVEVYENHYTMLGDNCFTYEKSIGDDAILGVLTSFQRNGKTIDTADKRYQLYVKLLRIFEKQRVFIKSIVFLIKKKCKKIVKSFQK